MATVTGLTAERMQEIIDATIVGAHITAGNLILELYDNTEVNVGYVKGDVGPIGPTGPIDQTDLDDAIAALKAVVQAAGAVTNTMLATNSVSTVKIANGAVTLAKLAANSVDATKIVANSITGSELAADAVGAGNIVDNAVTNAAMANNAIGNDELMDNSVSWSKLLNIFYQSTTPPITNNGLWFDIDQNRILICPNDTWVLFVAGTT